MRKYIDIRFIISTALIVLSFIVGIFFGGRLFAKNNQEQEYVNLIIKGKTLDVEKTNPNISIFINGKALGTGSINIDM